MNIYEIQIKYRKVAEDPTCPRSRKVESPEAVCRYLETAFDLSPEQEAFWVLLLDRKNHVKARHLITLGTQTSSLVHTREVFRTAIWESATAIICAHNHPSGDPAPSTADITVTRQLREAAKIIGIDLLDHVIVGNKSADPAGLGYYSFRSSGLL